MQGVKSRQYLIYGYTMDQNTTFAPHRATVIVIGNEKGGAGKTTSAMHLITSLLFLGFKVGSMDVDSRQLSLSRYVDNRRNTMKTKGMNLLMPEHYPILKSDLGIVADAEREEEGWFTQALEPMLTEKDFVVIDTPGSNSYLSRLAHSYADTVITPINDSFVDLDLLATVDADDLKIVKPGIYSQMVWEQKMQRAKRDRGSINWVVMRNRLSSTFAHNKKHVSQVLDKLAQRIGFRHAPGFSERVIFRELFLQGLTLLDVIEQNAIPVSLSHIAARQELRDFLKSLQIDKIDQALTREMGERTKVGA